MMLLALTLFLYRFQCTAFFHVRGIQHLYSMPLASAAPQTLRPNLRDQLTDITFLRGSTDIFGYETTGGTNSGTVALPRRY